MSGKLSGIRIPDDLIFSQSDGLQTFNEAFTFASTVNIFGTLSIADQLNGHHFKKMCEFLEPPPNAPLKLTIKGQPYHFCHYNLLCRNSRAHNFITYSAANDISM